MKSRSNRRAIASWMIIGTPRPRESGIAAGIRVQVVAAEDPVIDQGQEEAASAQALDELVVWQVAGKADLVLDAAGGQVADQPAHAGSSAQIFISAAAEYQHDFAFRQGRARSDQRGDGLGLIVDGPQQRRTLRARAARACRCSRTARSRSHRESGRSGFSAPWRDKVTIAWRPERVWRFRSRGIAAGDAAPCRSAPGKWRRGRCS